jgi:hypothetical protein
MNTIPATINGPIRHRIGFTGLQLETSDGSGGVILVGTIARDLRRNQQDMLTAGEAAESARVRQTQVQTWIRHHRCIFVEELDGTARLPAWQFKTPLWEALPQIFEAIGTKDGWEALSFLETPTHLLEGATARAVIERGDLVRVFSLVRNGD